MRPTDRPSPNFGPRPPGAAIDMVILHYTGMRTAEEALERLCDPDAEVSAHYAIDEDGEILRLVDESRRAWHAGQSCWRGDTDINDRSIGIELVNPGHEFGYRAFPEPQMTALEELLGDIVRRRGIAPARILGHSDVAPARKRDPGELFDWRGWPERGSRHGPTPETPAIRPATRARCSPPSATMPTRRWRASLPRSSAGSRRTRSRANPIRKR